MTGKFEGFKAVDFNESVAGTKWRGLLGKALASAMRGPGHPYRAWSVPRDPQLHIAHEGEYKHGDQAYNVTRAKLFVRTIPGELAYGFYIEAPGQKDKNFSPGSFKHWQKFKSGLRSATQMRARLFDALKKHSLVVMDYGAGQPWQAKTPDELARSIDPLPKDTWVNLHVVKRVKQADAIAAKSGVVRNILEVLTDLSAIYEDLL
ncbi:hypothetical protein JXD38_12610 [candidate division WOR-3 bacterium]|nr:hypothetical protein [candidate division WOR-3 bacterium]